ncbi:MAG: spore cortex biosynthesis protein YabQ [Oscillospiraceae bacterium]|nr:spore cortex biosynthesis protein YabQ [Oscillospiraceae bacterium]
MLGVVYDVFRRLRRHAPHLTVPLDILYGCITFTALVLFGLSAGNGLLRLYSLFGAALGAAVYFGAVSPLVLALLCRLERVLSFLLRTLLHPLQKFFVFFEKIGRKIFSFFKKWFTIMVQQWKSGLTFGGVRNENLASSSGSTGVRRIRYGNAAESSRGNSRKRNAGGGTVRKSRSRRAGKPASARGY